MLLEYSVEVFLWVDSAIYFLGYNVQYEKEPYVYLEPTFTIYLFISSVSNDQKKSPMKVFFLRLLL